jgi:hypothetical protein
MAGTGFVREWLRGRQIDREVRALREESERLRARNFEIASLHALIDSGEYLEREARTKLGLRREGEQVVVIRKEDARTAPDAQARLVDRGLGEGWSNPKKWLMVFADPAAFKEYAGRTDP